MIRRRIYQAAAALMLLAGCHAHRPAAGGGAAPLLPGRHQVWQLVSVRGKEVSRERHIITLRFNPEAATLGGQGPCNSYSAPYRLEEAPMQGAATRHALGIGAVETTDIQCPEAGANAESRHLGLLAKADALEMTEYTLTLFQKGKEILKYELQ